MKLDVNALKEDSRKLGLGLMAAGILGLVVTTDQMSWSDGIMVVIVGLVIWLAALLQEDANGH